MHVWGTFFSASCGQMLRSWSSGTTWQVVFSELSFRLGLFFAGDCVNAQGGQCSDSSIFVECSMYLGCWTNDQLHHREAVGEEAEDGTVSWLNDFQLCTLMIQRCHLETWVSQWWLHKIWVDKGFAVRFHETISSMHFFQEQLRKAPGKTYFTMDKKHKLAPHLDWMISSFALWWFSAVIRDVRESVVITQNLSW